MVDCNIHLLFYTGPPTGTAFPISANSGPPKPVLSFISERINNIKCCLLTHDVD